MEADSISNEISEKKETKTWRERIFGKIEVSLELVNYATLALRPNFRRVDTNVRIFKINGATQFYNYCVVYYANIQIEPVFRFYNSLRHVLSGNNDFHQDQINNGVRNVGTSANLVVRLKLSLKKYGI